VDRRPEGARKRALTLLYWLLFRVAETATGISGLQDKGDGYYQLDWKSPKSYAKSCKTVHLDLGEGITHDAYFDFKK